MYAVIQQINGAFTVQFESNDLESIKVNYHQWIAALYNDTGAVNGIVKLVDSNLELVEGNIEIFNKPAKEQGD